MSGGSPRVTLRQLIEAAERVDPVCRQNPDLWMDPKTTEDVESAKAWCAVCRIRNLCDVYATDSGETSGVWGGIDYGGMQPESLSDTVA